MRKTIGTNPLDAVVPHLSTPTHTEKAGDDANGSVTKNDYAARDGAARSGYKKERLTIHIPISLIERAKNTVFWTPGLTLAGLGERALDALVSDLEKQNGGAFETRPHELKGGRPLK